MSGFMAYFLIFPDEKKLAKEEWAQQFLDSFQQHMSIFPLCEKNTMNRTCLKLMEHYWCYV